MCGRYVIDDNTPEIEELLREISRKYPDTSVKTGEIFPTETVPVLLGNKGAIAPEIAAWGFPNFRKKGVIINARSETVLEKRMFQSSFLQRRCAIVSTGFFEWHNKQKYLFQSKNPVLYIGGFYNSFENERRMVILTTSANESVSEIHDRMPIILEPDKLQSWITDTDAAKAIISNSQPTLFKRQYYCILSKVEQQLLDAANISNGCIAIIKKAPMLHNGEIGAVMIDGEATIKQFFMEDDKVKLIPLSHNTKHPVQIYNDKNDVLILGKVVKAIVDI